MESLARPHSATATFYWEQMIYQGIERVSKENRPSIARLPLAAAQSRNGLRPTRRGLSKEGELMKALSILGKSIALVLLAALASSVAYAQFEVDPDHFDSPSVEPHPQPSPSPTQVKAKRYDGNFSLPYSVQCSGKKLAPGKYSVSLGSDGKVGHGVLQSKSQSIEITSVVHPQSSKGADVLVVRNKGRARTLSVIKVAGMNFVLDPTFKVDASSSSENQDVETLPLTLMAFKRSPNRARR